LRNTTAASGASISVIAWKEGSFSTSRRTLSKLTITPPDTKLEAKHAAKAEVRLAKEVKSEKVIRDTFDAKATGKPTILDKATEKLVSRQGTEVNVHSAVALHGPEPTGSGPSV
jgi:hypothetical protein